jgi:hypothetical protein
VNRAGKRFVGARSSPRRRAAGGPKQCGSFCKQEKEIMSIRIEPSKLRELSEIQALAINGGDGETPTFDEDGVCDEESVGNVKVTTNNTGTQGTISTCTEKVKRNGDTVYKWKVTETFGM